MKRPVITMNIIKEDIGYSAHTLIQGKFIGTEGDDFEDLKTNILEVVNLSFKDQHFTYQMEDIVIKRDLII
ncbi:hypothetical protein [Dyadobacter pollutisoli]|jgi:hypothetical protein|uniref:Uncharacterized protein n=1 Tax=Dyadobacter pollutisoli TaxID=2910158 RepID=A0A9E8NB61_9BACT|nr:hypothetical protein [Dyadobacter pollutisoli]WAC11321.1 hypothetical protein ON006_26765 [Dyadobacter pollutisoli]